MNIHKKSKLMISIIAVIIAVSFQMVLTSCEIRYEKTVFEKLTEVNINILEIDETVDNASFWGGVIAVSDGFLATAGAHPQFDNEAQTGGGAIYPDKVFLIKYNEYGEKQWERGYRLGGKICFISGGFEVSDGFIMYGGSTEGRGKDVFVKFDKQGSFLWAKSPYFYSMVQNQNGFLVVGGDNQAKRGSKDYKYTFLMQFDSNGDVLWKKTVSDKFRASGNNHVISETQIAAANNGYFLRGTTYTKELGASAFSATPTYPMLAFYDREANLLWERNDMEHLVIITDSGFLSFLSDGNMMSHKVLIKQTDFYNNPLWEMPVEFNYGWHGNVSVIESCGHTIITGDVWIEGGTGSYIILIKDGEVILKSDESRVLIYNNLMKTSNGFAVSVQDKSSFPWKEQLWIYNCTEGFLQDDTPLIIDMS